MSRFGFLTRAIGAVFVLVVLSFGAAAETADPFAKDSVWTGTIAQGAERFPATITIKAADMGRVAGEIRFTIGAAEAKLSFQGALRNVKGQKIVVWITDKKAGEVTYPGLYVASLSGKTLAGTWEVPSAGQFDTFSVTLQE
jgi:hypothetical protein